MTNSRLETEDEHHSSTEYVEIEDKTESAEKSRKGNYRKRKP